MRAFFAFLFLLSLSCRSMATIKTAIGNSGNGWSVNSNWSPSGVPQDGDTAVIPSGLTLYVKGNIYNPSTPLLIIRVFGILSFDPSGKLNLSTSSVVAIFNGGAITSGGASSSIITIGGVIKFDGHLDGTLIGPRYASASTGTSPNGFTPGVLAIKMVSFDYQLINNHVKLYWKASHDNNSDSFEIQRSLNNNSWTRLAVMPVTGNIYELNDYTYTDDFPEKGINLYRILLRNYQAQENYSKTISVNLSARPGPITVFPNPAVASAMMTWSQENNLTPLYLAIMNSNGQIAVQKEIATGINFLQIDIKSLPAGVYTVVVTDYRDFTRASSLLVVK